MKRHNQLNYLLGLSSLLLWGSLVFLALSICGTAGVFGTDGRAATVGTAGSDTPVSDLGTEGDGSAFSTLTSFAPLASSPQWGQNLRSFKMEAQSWWKRWEMLPYGLHSIKVPCGTEYLKHLSCHFNTFSSSWVKTWHYPESHEMNSVIPSLTLNNDFNYEEKATKGTGWYIRIFIYDCVKSVQSVYLWLLEISPIITSGTWINSTLNTVYCTSSK